MDPAAEQFVIRRIASADELARAVDVAGAQVTPQVTSGDRRADDLFRRLDQDRPLLVGAFSGGAVVGAALAFRPDDGLCALRLIGLVPWVRGRGLGRRLMEVVELEAMAFGCISVTAGGVGPESKGFYQRLGFTGRHSTVSKQLPLPGRLRDLRIARLRAAAGDLHVGAPVLLDAGTGRASSLGGAGARA
jgi:GNAT superfamily N-acetyltransferase